MFRVSRPMRLVRAAFRGSTKLTETLYNGKEGDGRHGRTDPGNPEKCPVWPLHQVYSDEACRNWVQEGCRSAGIGCLECKQPVIDGILREQVPMRERAQTYIDNPKLVRDIIADGNDKARKLAQETMRDVREAMGLNYG